MDCKEITELKFDVGPNKNLKLGHGASKGASYSLFYDCPLDSVTLRRGTNYSTSSNNGYSPFANHPTLRAFTFTNLNNTGSYLLYGCGKLTSVTLNNTMVTIDDYAFANCKSLSHITIPSKITTLGKAAFANCNWFTSFTIGSGVESIGESCFSGMISLDSLVIPGNVTSIGNYAFSNCTRIKKLKFEQGPATLSLGYGSGKGSEYGLFYDCPLEEIIINRGINYYTDKSKGYSPFAYNNTLVKVSFGDGATRIGNYLFLGDKELSSVSMSETVKAIGNYALYGCVGIKSLTIGRSVESIGNYAFSGCEQLTGLIFPPSVSSIGNYAFRGCTSFNNFTIEESTETMTLGYGASGGDNFGLFNDCPLVSVFIGRNLNYNTDQKYGYSPLAYHKTLTEVRFGNPVTRIPSFILWNATEVSSIAFNKSCKLKTVGKCGIVGCSNLKELNLPESVTTIEFGAFQSLPFKSFIIGPIVETIGDYAFNNCKQLTGLIIPPSVKSIGNYAFKNCSLFNNITFEESDDALALGNGSSEGEKYALFHDCPLTSVFIGRNLTYSYAPFGGVKTIVEARFGNPVTRIPNSILCGLTELENVYFNKSCKVTTIGKYAFDGCSKLALPVFPDNITTIEEGAFRGCTNFTTYTISATLSNIGNYVFNGCTGLTKLIVEDSNNKLTLGYGSDSGNNDKEGKGLFYDCPLNTVYIGRAIDYNAGWRYGSSPFANIPSITDFTFGDQVTSIGAQFLRGCSGIQELVTPNSVTSIGKSAFINCSSLKNIKLSSSLSTIADYAFYGCSSLTDLVIPASVTSIGNYALFGCSSLSNLVLEDGEKTLTMGYGASGGKGFGLAYDCPLKTLYLGRTLSYEVDSKGTYGYSPFNKQQGLEEVTIGPKVTSLGYCAFYNCSSISELYIPSSVRTIHSSFASNCSSLKKVIILGTTPPTTDSYNKLISGTAEGSKFYVFFPNNYKKVQPWKDYTDRIDPICAFEEDDFSYTGRPHTLKYQTEFPITLSNLETETESGSYTKHINVTYTTNGYDFEDVIDYAYTIDKANIVVSVDNVEREYGENNPEFSVVLDGFAEGEDATVLEKEPVASTTAKKSSSVGTYDITVSGAQAKNYTFNYKKGTLTVTKAPLRVSTGDYEREEGEDNPKFVLTYDGWKLDDDESVLKKKPTISCEATQESVPGEYDIVISGGEAKNYDFIYLNGILTVKVKSGITQLTGDGGTFDVYTVNGQPVRLKATSLKGLQKGIYIINGRKVVIK